MILNNSNGSIVKIQYDYRVYIAKYFDLLMQMLFYFTNVIDSVNL